MAGRQQKLRAFAKKDLLYEVEMLRGLTDRLLEILEHDRAHGGRDLPYLDMATRNAQVESFAIHARALLDFLVAEPKGDDASARHYVVGWDDPELTEALQVVRRRVGKEIAHMTYHRVRVSDEARQWRYRQIWLDVATLLRMFVSSASSELLPREVAATILELTKDRREVTMFPLAAHAASATGPLPGPGTATYGLTPKT